MDISDVVSDYVTLKKKGSGKYLWACCPFHDEKTPSFSVTPDRGIYKCFGCGKSGDSINFVMEHDGLSYAETIRQLAKKYGIEVKETQGGNSQDDEAQQLKDSLYIVMEYANKHFRDNLTENDEGKSIAASYFRERGIDQAAVDTFQLGYSVNSWDNLFKDATSKAYSEELLEKAGLIVRKSETKVYDRFRGRVIFPIRNVSGKVIAFGARTLRKDDKPKYLNSPESEIYHKSKVLYGIYLAKNHIRQKDKCYLVEGYTDVISMHMSGLPNVVASSGTSLTEDQIKLIARFSKNITVLYDGDAAGIKASLRGIDMILEAGMNVRTVIFPEGQDPDSYAQQLGSSGFQNFIEENEQDFISFKVSLFAREAGGDPIKRAESIKEILSTIAKVPDGVKRAVYMKETARLLEFEESVLWTELNKLHRQTQKKESRNASNIPPPPPPIEEAKPKVASHNDQIVIHEREFIRLLIKFGESQDTENRPFHEAFIPELDEIKWVSSVCKEIFTMYLECLREGIKPTVEYFVRNGSQEAQKEVADLISERHEVSNQWFDKYKIFVPGEHDLTERMFITNLARMKRSIVQKLIDDHKEKLRGASDPADIDRLLHIQQELKKTERELADMLGIVIPK